MKKYKNNENRIEEKSGPIEGSPRINARRENRKDLKFIRRDELRDSIVKRSNIPRTIQNIR